MAFPTRTVDENANGRVFMYLPKLVMLVNVQKMELIWLHCLQYLSRSGIIALLGIVIKAVVITSAHHGKCHAEQSMTKFH